MARNFVFSAPSFLFFGKDERKNIGTYLKKWAHGKTVMVISGSTVSGLEKFQDILDSIRAGGFDTVLYTSVQPEAPVGCVRKGVRIAEEHEINAVVAVGGGSSIDVAKAITIMLNNDGDIIDYCKSGMDSIPNQKNIPLFAVPTTCGTGTEMTDGGVIYDEETQYKYGFWDAFTGPDVAIVDVAMIEQMPLSVMAFTAMDAISHAFEGCTTNNSNPISDALGLEAIRLLVENLPVAYKDSGNIEALENVFVGSVMAGMTFNRTGIHAGHSAGQALGALAHIPHGVTCAIFLPYVAYTQAERIPDKVALIGEKMGLSIPKGATPKEIGTIVGDRLWALNRQLHIPTLKELNVDRDLFEHFAEYAMNEPFQLAAPVPSTRENLKEYWDKLFDEE